MAVPLAVPKWVGSIAIDGTPRMVQMAQQRLGTLVKVFQADLSKPLNFLEDEASDLILSSLVLHYIRDWDKVFKEFNKILQKSGLFVFFCGSSLC